MSIRFGSSSWEIAHKVKFTPALFYKVFSLYFNDEKKAVKILRENTNEPMMDCKKAIHILKDEYSDNKIIDMLDNIKEFNPELTI